VGLEIETIDIITNGQGNRTSPFSVTINENVRLIASTKSYEAGEIAAQFNISETVQAIATEIICFYAITCLIYFIMSCLIDMWFKRVNDEERRKLIRKQIAHSLPALFVGCVASVFWTTFLDPLSPYDNYYVENSYSVSLAVQNLVIFFILYDTVFYWSHRILHIQDPINLYKIFHKAHHYTHMTSWAATATHPFEIVCNVFGLHFTKFFTPIPYGMHVALIIFTTFSGVIAHDEKLDIFDHYLHHEKHNCNFSGYLPIWDWLMGTRDVDINKKNHLRKISYLEDLSTPV